MGLFKKVFGTGDTTLSLRVEADRVPTGGEVVLRWDVGGELDDKVRVIRAGVTATGFWLEREEDRDHGHDHDHDRIEKREAEVWAETQDFEPALGPGSATFRIPEDAPPGSKEVLKWTAWVAIDRERARDHVEEVTLYVRRPAQETAPRELTGDGFQVTGVPDALRLGGSHAGTVRLTVGDAMAGTVRLFLVRRVRHVSSRAGTSLVELFGMPKLPGADLLAGAGIRDEHVIVRQEEELELDVSGGKVELEPGRPHEWAFQLEVPGRGPTTAHDNAQVDWRLVVKLDRRMRGDLRVAMPVDVS